MFNVNIISIFRTILGAHSMILHVALRDASYVEGRTGVYKVSEEDISPAILQLYTVQCGHRTLPTFQQFWQKYCNLVEFVT